MNDESNLSLIASESSSAITPEPLHLTVNFEQNVFSQSGEDGIIAKILEVYEIVNPGICVDIGAHDGVYLSNTANLRTKGWATLLVEQDSTHLPKLTEAFRDGNISPIIARITPDNVLDHTAKFMGNPWVDLLSIDIDGDDLAVVLRILQAAIRPRIICIEYNPTFPPFLYRMNPQGTSKGSSMRTIIDELNKLEYDCVYATISNVILVDRTRNDNKIRGLNTFEAFRWDAVRFVCSDYDGQNYVATASDIIDEAVNPWDQLPSVQVMQYPGELLGFNTNNDERRTYQTNVLKR